MTKLFLLSVISILLSSCVSAAPCITLPEVKGWYNGKMRVTELKTVSGNKGTWLERTYRTEKGVSIRAIWIDGSGDRGWAPESVTYADDGKWGTGAHYKTLQVAGNIALLDEHPVTGLSLAVKIKSKGTLTLESKSAEEGELCSAAEMIVTAVDNTSSAE